MHRIPKRSPGLLFVLILALLAAWGGESLAHHDHDDHADPCCAVCRAAGNPSDAPRPAAPLTGTPLVDTGDRPAPDVPVPVSVTARSSPPPRAPPTA